jgi:LDH2 family malate/lactate/ureidoglycolate dehydrogenase
MLAIDPSAFSPNNDFKQQVEAFVKYLKETPPADGFSEVLYPGEIEYRTGQRRGQEGIPIEDNTWNRLTEIGQRFNVGHLLQAAS